jgi:hypothetical protein
VFWGCTSKMLTDHTYTCFPQNPLSFSLPRKVLIARKPLHVPRSHVNLLKAKCNYEHFDSRLHIRARSLQRRWQAVPSISWNHNPLSRTHESTFSCHMTYEGADNNDDSGYFRWSTNRRPRIPMCRWSCRWNQRDLHIAAVAITKSPAHRLCRYDFCRKLTCITESIYSCRFIGARKR